MDLAVLQVVVKNIGTQQALKNLDSLAEKTGQLEDRLASLSRKTGSRSSVNKGLKEYGETAKIAAAHVKELRDAVSSLGVGKLSELVAASKRIREEVTAAAADKAKIAKANEQILISDEKVKRSQIQTSQIRQKAIQQDREGSAKLAREWSLHQAKIRSEDSKTAISRNKAAAVSVIAQGQVLNATRATNAQIQVSNAKAANAQENLIGIRRRNTEAAHKSAEAEARAAIAQNDHKNSLVSSTSSWLQHAKSVAGGIVLYQGIRTAINLVTGAVIGGIEAVSDYQTNVIQLASTIASLSSIKDPFRAYELSSKYAADLVPTLEQVDRLTVLNFDHLMMMSQEFAKEGVLIDTNNQKQVRGFTLIANAVALYSRNGQDARQVQQEIHAVLTGQTRTSDRLAKLLDSILGGRLKPMLAEWKKQGTVIENVSGLLKGFGPALSDMETSWATVTSSMQTTFNIIARETLTPLMEKWAVDILSFNDALLENKVEIANWSRVTITAFENVGSVVFKSVTLQFELVGGLSELVAQAAGIDMPNSLDFLGNKWQITAGIIAGATNVIVESLIETKFFVLQLANAFVSLNDVAANALTGGNVGAALSRGQQRSTELYKQRGSEIAKARQDMLKAMAYESYNPKKKQKTSELDKELQELRDSMRNSGSGGSGGSGGKGGKGGRGGKTDYESRSTLLEKWNGELNKELAAQFKLKDVAEIQNAIEEKNITLREKGLHVLLPEEKRELQLKMASLQVQKRITEEMNRMYEDITGPQQKLNDVKQAAVELLKIEPGLHDEIARSVRKATKAYEDQIDPLSDMIEKLKEERAVIGLSGDELELYQTHQQAVNKLLSEGYRLTDADTQAKLAKVMSEKKINLELQKEAEQDLWLQMKEGSKTFFEGFSDSLNDMVWGAETSFSDILKDYLKMLTKMVIETQIMKPLLNDIFGGGSGSNVSGASSALDALFSSSPNLFAKGGFPGRLTAFANGGMITNKPTLFPMAHGGIGIMSEFGQDEAVMPVEKVGGVLGVKADISGLKQSSPNVSIIIQNNTGSPISEDTKTEFDSDNYIVTVVLNAADKNKNGFRDALSSMVSKRR